MGTLRTALDAFWKTLGRPRRAAVGERSTATGLDLLVPGHSGEDQVIGTLTRAGDQFLFRYSDGFKRQASIPPIPEFPDKDREYRSAYLWPFFEVRLPPTDRSDIQELMRSKDLDDADTFRLLAELARKSVTTPYEFRLHDPASAA